MLGHADREVTSMQQSMSQSTAAPSAQASTAQTKVRTWFMFAADMDAREGCQGRAELRLQACATHAVEIASVHWVAPYA